MIKELLLKIKNYPERLRYRFGPRLACWLTDLAIIVATRKLKGGKPLELLVDNSVLGHAITHETAWISTGLKKWGLQHVETGYSARIPVHSPNDDNWVYKNIQFLPGITQLARKGVISLKTSGELQAEQIHQPVGRFLGYGSFDLNLFGGLEIHRVDKLAFPTLGPSYMNLPSPREQQKTRIRSSKDELYIALAKILGPKNDLDAWHLATAEKHDLFCFLTMDAKLCRNFQSNRNKEPIKSMRSKPMTPSDFGSEFNIIPLPPTVYSYNDASFPVRSDLNWGKGVGRKRPNRKD